MCLKKSENITYKFVFVRGRIEQNPVMRQKRLIAFAAYFRRYEEIFQEDCKSTADKENVRRLLRKLAPVEYEKHCNFIEANPKTSEICFLETIELLSKIFSGKSSLFNTRWECWNPVKRKEEDFVTYAGAVNRMCVSFKLRELLICLSASFFYKG